MEKLNTILSLVSEYINEKNDLKTWTPGKDWIQYAGPYFSDEEYINAIKSLLEGWLVLGKDATKFEGVFPKYFNKKYGLLTNSGSSANLLMLLAMTSRRLYNLPKGTKVITPIAGFPTTINPIFQVGFEPIFVDIEIDTLNLDLDKVEQAIKENPDCKIITFAHVLGNPPDMERLMYIVNKHNLYLLEDCCDALGSTYNNSPLGSFGIMATCSFYPAHHITTCEGGFVSMNNKNEERVVRSFREWGRGCYCSGKTANLLKNGTCKHRFDTWLPSMSSEIFDHKYVYEEIGYNLKPIELQASIGLAQIKKIPEIVSKRKHNYEKIFEIFSEYEDVFHLPYKQKNSDPAWFAFPLTIRDGVKFNRSDFCQYLEDNLIQTRPYFAGNLMMHPGYSHLYNQSEIKNNFKNATKSTTDTFFIGTSPVITDEMISYIKQITNKFFTDRTTK